MADQIIKGSNLLKNARYDPILHLPKLKKRFTNSGGTLDFYGSDAFSKKLFPDGDYTLTKFSFQLSRYFPVWAQLKTDIDSERLDQIVQDGKK